jgi:hypothetical protein
MVLVRVLSIARLAALMVATTALMTGCQTKKPSDEAGGDKLGVAAGAEESSKQRPAASGAGPTRPGDERFAARIAENLARVADPEVVIPEGAGASESLDNAGFRSRAVAFVQQVAAGGEKATCELPLSSKRPFRALVSAYRQGDLVARGEASDHGLCAALKSAARRAVAAAGGERGSLAGARLVIDLPDHDQSFVEYQDKGIELTHGLVPVRVLDKALLRKRIDESKDYLLRVIDPARKGVHKYYHAVGDRFEPQLHTIYTASTALTLLKLRAYDGDARLLDQAAGLAGFMLGMQSHDEHDHTAGGFFYAFDLERQRPERKLVVGTASKTLFTLLELHAATQEKKYLDAALSAAGWLISMQRPDGSVRSYLNKGDGDRWMVQKKESMLYTGQLLSALSRTYRATRDKKYLNAAGQTADYLMTRVSMKGCYVGDDYRKANPISSSWVILSLLDFVKATGDVRFEQTVFRCAGELLKRQWKNPADAYRYGRWQGSLSSSGNGWLAEVMSEVYLHCREKGMDGCDRFKDAVVSTVRLLAQYTYSPENAFVVKNPEAAQGGVFWSVMDRYVRTDSVCHATNAYLNIIDHLGDGPLIELPERPLSARLSLDSETSSTALEPDLAEQERDDAAGESASSPDSMSEDPTE